MAAPQFADLTFDEQHKLLYGSDRAGGKVWVFSLPTLIIAATIDMGTALRSWGLDFRPTGSPCRSRGQAPATSSGW